MTRIHVTSEIGRLRRVIVHAPGPEVLAVTPGNRENYLYDDIIDLNLSLEEHRRFTSILKRFAQVLDFRDLLAQVLDVAEARQFLLHRAEDVTADRRLKEQLAGCSNAELAERLIEGWRPGRGPFSEQLERQSYVLPPLPNLLFVRDAAVVI